MIYEANQAAFISPIINQACLLREITIRQSVPAASALSLKVWDLSTLSGSVTDATNATPIVITSVTHGLKTNDVVTIANVMGNFAANGTFAITRVDADTFSLQNSAGSNVAGTGTYTSGGTWFKGSARCGIVSSTNATPIVVTTGTHGFAVGDLVTIEGHLTNTNAVGTWVIAAVAATTIELQGSVGNGVGLATGTVTKLNALVLDVPAGQTSREVKTTYVFEGPRGGKEITNGLAMAVHTTFAGVTTPTTGQEPVVRVDYQPIGQGL